MFKIFNIFIGFQVPERCHWRVARGQRGLLGRLVRRHQLVRHPRQACDHHAKGYSARQKNPWRTSLNPVSTVHCIPPSSTRTQTVSRRQTSSQNLHIFRPPFSSKESTAWTFPIIDLHHVEEWFAAPLSSAPCGILPSSYRTSFFFSFFFDPTFVFETVT